MLSAPGGSWSGSGHKRGEHHLSVARSPSTYARSIINGVAIDDRSRAIPKRRN
jgi:hypothetical protein